MKTEDRRDIETRQDIEKLVDRFYARVRKDDVIGYIFNDVAKVHWESHIPRIVDFWEAVLFRQTLFDGNPLDKHMKVDQKETLREEHFARWLSLFHRTIDDLFAGETAEAAKYRSKNIAGVFMQHLDQRRNKPSFHLGSLE